MKFRAILNDENDLAFIDEEKVQLKPWMKTGLFFLIWSAILISLSIIYIVKSRYIYFWDDANYWKIARNIASGKLTHGGLWENVYESIGSQDYNYLAGVISSSFVYLFGGSRVVYILGIVLAYLIPSVMVMYMLAKKLGKSPEFTVSLILLMCPVIVGLAFYGFVDIGGLLICLLCYQLYFTGENQKQSVIGNIVKSMIIGALLVILMIWRRYFAFFAVSFITAMVADVILFRKKWYCVPIVIITAAAITFFCFRDFLTNILLADYGNIYSGYKYSPSLDLKLVTRYFGILFLLFIAAGSVFLCVKKKEYKPIILWIQIISCAAMFIATQTHGQQHLLLYLPSIIVLLILIIKHIDNTWIKAAICAFALVNAVSVEIPRSQPQNIQEISHYAIIPDFSILPQSRPDVYRILSLKRSLDTVVEKGSSIGVLASSLKLNEDILANVEPSLNISQKRKDYIREMPQVDSRDTEISALFEVEYMLVAYPAQTHLADGKQTVITEAVDSFYNYTDFARAFTEMYDYETQVEDITVKLFKKTREITELEQIQFKNKLYK